MLRMFARWWARKKYVLSQEVEAATNDLNAGLSLRLSTEKRALIEKLNKEADEMDARIKEVSEMEEKGFYSCENGHENASARHGDGLSGCLNCNSISKFIKRSEMTGQEKYESDKERKEAEDVAKSKRDQAKAEEENAANGEKTAKYFHGLAENNRTIASRIRHL